MNSKLKFILVFCLISQFAFSDPYDPPASEEPVAPINSWLIYLTVVGLLYAFIFFKKRVNTSQKN